MTLMKAFSGGFKFIMMLFSIIALSIVTATIANYAIWFTPDVIRTIFSVFVFLGTIISLIVYIVDGGYFDKVFFGE